MATPEIEQAKAPLCPHCKAVMDKVGMFSWRAPGSATAILAVYCDACQTLLHMGIAPVIEERRIQ